MNNLEVIGIDHGWSQMKTVHEVFSSGVEEILSEPAFFDDVLEYDGKYYKIGTKRDTVMENNLSNEDYYLLTLVGIAREMKARSLHEARLVLGAGLPVTRYVDGSLNIFNHHTNVDMENRFMVYAIRDLGEKLSPICMLVMMESIQHKIIENGLSGLATWLYIDEFHVLLDSVYTAAYLQQLWKKVRKQGGLCTGITQNVIDLLSSSIATTMLSNSEFVVIMKQSGTDSEKMAEVLQVSQEQLRYVLNAPAGTGLIKCGSVVIPFDNQIGKDTELYRIYSTNIHEKIEQKEANKHNEKKEMR